MKQVVRRPWCEVKVVKKRSSACLRNQNRLWFVRLLSIKPAPRLSPIQIHKKRKRKKMVETKSKVEEIRHWIVEHKLRTVGCLWLSGITGSIAYNWSQPNMKTSVRIIHARLHAQALTLAALAGAAVVEYYDHKSGAKTERIAKFLPPMDRQTHKD